MAKSIQQVNGKIVVDTESLTMELGQVVMDEVTRQIRESVSFSKLFVHLAFVPPIAMIMKENLQKIAEAIKLKLEERG